MPQKYIPVKEKAAADLRSRLFDQLEQTLKNGKTETERKEAALRLTELQISAERLESAKLTRAPLQTRVNELEERAEEFQQAAAENTSLIAAQQAENADLTALVAVLTTERDTAIADAQRRGRECDAANYQLSDARNTARTATENIDAAKAALQSFKDGAAAFVAGLSITPETLIDILLKAEKIDKAAPVEMVIACGIAPDRAEHFLKTVKAAKTASTVRLVDLVHLDSCPACRKPDATGRLQRMPSQDEIKVFRAILKGRGVDAGKLERELTILRSQHSLTSNVYVPPADIPAVLSVEDREIERQKVAGTYVPPAPTPEPEKPTMVSLTRYWAPILPFRDAFQEFQISMADYYPEADRSRTVYERLRREGLAQEAKQRN